MPFLATLVAAVPAFATPDVPTGLPERRVVPKRGAGVIDFENVTVRYAVRREPVLAT